MMTTEEWNDKPAGATQPVVVTVKPLVWRGSYGCLIAKGVGVEYYAFTKGWNTSLDGTTHPAESREDAVAACQAHYDALLRAELTIQPAAPLSDPRVVALVEARIAHMAAVDAYNDKRSEVNRRRQLGDWSLNLDAEYKSMSNAQGEFFEAAQNAADALRAIGGEA